MRSFFEQKIRTSLFSMFLTKKLQAQVFGEGLLFLITYVIMRPRKVSLPGSLKKERHKFVWLSRKERS